MAEYDVIDDLGAPAGSTTAPPKGETMLSIGPVHLSASTTSYARLKRSSAWRWPSQDAIGHAPGLEWLGPGRDTIVLDGAVHPAARPGGGVLAALRSLAAEGSPRMVVGGDGEQHGRYAIVKLDETSTALFPDGSPRKIQWSLTLEYGGAERPRGQLTGLGERAAALGTAAPQIAAAETALDEGLGGQAAASRVSATVAGTPTDQQRRAVDAARAAGGGDALAVLEDVEGAVSAEPGAAPPPGEVSVAYRAKAGETLADIAWRKFGDAHAVVDLLALNERHQLAGRLEAGDLVNLPARVDAPQAVRELVTLWS